MSLVYAINVLFGIGAAIYLPAWRKTFARYVDIGKEGQNYAISDMFLSITRSLASVAGGLLVELTGSFSYVFLVASLFTLIGGLSMLTLLNDTR
ncbi:MFS transporter [Candidatus Nomurabacteria bacterium]|nr:MFS transporter [Candidatus Nomurabacteria bacterium]MCB9803247.1 MFS transporter [Candidatus Nomurabacteria bacterium]